VTAATTWYCSPRSTTTTTVVGSPGGGELDDGISLRQKTNTRVGMAILPAGSGIHGYLTRRIRVRVRNLTRGPHPYLTRDKIGSGTGFILRPRVLADIRNNLSFHCSISAHKKPADRGPAQCPETLVSLHSHTVTRRTQPQPRRSLTSHLSALSVSQPPPPTGHRHSASKPLLWFIARPPVSRLVGQR
jgi:hypothetical protein